MVNYLYLDLIKKSRINYVDGGKMQYVTMKYLEAGISGSLLLSPNMGTLEEYGFKPNVHFEPYATNQELTPLFDKKSWDMKYKTIRNNCFDLVVEKHSTELRVTQFNKVIETIISQKKPNLFKYNQGDLFYDGKLINEWA